MILHKMTIAEAKKIDLVEYLVSLGLQPKKYLLTTIGISRPLEKKQQFPLKLTAVYRHGMISEWEKAGTLLTSASRFLTALLKIF